MADLSGALEMVAHAANILAVGEAHAMTPTSDASHHQGPGTAGDVSGSGLGAGGGEPGDEANRSGNTAADNTSSASSAAPGIFGGSTGMAGASGALAGTGLASAKNGVSLTRQGIPTGAVDKLRNMCANKHFNRKMDWFDPAWLQVSHRLTTRE